MSIDENKNRLNGEGGTTTRGLTKGGFTTTTAKRPIEVGTPT
jgi:hypothetical protein